MDNNKDMNMIQEPAGNEIENEQAAHGVKPEEAAQTVAENNVVNEAAEKTVETAADNGENEELTEGPGLSAVDSKKIDDLIDSLSDDAKNVSKTQASQSEMLKEELAETEEAVNQAEEEMHSSKDSFAKAARQMLAGKKEMAAQKWHILEAERKEKKEERLHAAQQNKEARQQEFERRKTELVHTTAQLSGKLRNMLAEELEAKKKREKTRGAQIMGVFAKHNFYANGFTPVELRTTLEDLGPTYVKIGQIMSSRVDMLPESYCKELEKLRQNVKELDPEIARAVIEQETGKKIDEIYLEFRDKPLGSASIGQAHYGVLKDGTRVVTKVQRPLIAEMMREDFVLLKKLGSFISTIGGSSDDNDQMIDLVSVVEELEKVTEEELDFRIEAENTRFFKENCIEDEEKISCPTVIDELTTERIFTMTFVDGYSIAKKQRLIDEGYDPVQIGTVILDNYLHQVLDIGTFHADPHQGNIMVSHGKPVWIDFGMIGRITDADISLLQSLILSLISQDMDTLVTSIMAMGATSSKTDRSKLTEDAEVMFDKYMNVQNLNDLDMAVLFEEITSLCDTHHISLPGKYTMLARSIATIEGVIEQLCPELNLFQQITDKLMLRMRKSLDVGQELLSAGKDMLELSKKVSKMPGLAYDVLNAAVKGRLKVNFGLTGYEEFFDRFDQTTKNIVLAIFASVMFLGSCLLSSADIQPKTSGGQPLIAMIGMIFSIALGIYTVKKMTKKKK